MRELRLGHAAATTQIHHVVLRQFFTWLVQEGEREDNPLLGRPLPKVQSRPVAVIGDQELQKLLATCASPSFEDRRDTAVIRLLLDTGMRRAELAGLGVVPLGRAAKALDLSVGRSWSPGKFQAPPSRSSPPCAFLVVKTASAARITTRNAHGAHDQRGPDSRPETHTALNFPG